MDHLDANQVARLEILRMLDTRAYPLDQLLKAADKLTRFVLYGVVPDAAPDKAE